MKTAGGQQEIGAVTPVEAYRHAAGEREGEHAGIEQNGIEADLLGRKIDRAEEIDLELEDRDVVGGKRHAQDADEEKGRPRNLEDDAELEADDRRGSPTELASRSDQEPPRLRREDALQIVDDPWRVGHDVLREEDRIEHALAQSQPQLLLKDGAVDAEQAADAVQGETEAQLDGRKFGGDDEDQRITLGTVGQAGVEDADRLDVDDFLELQLEGAGIFAAVGREAQKSSAEKPPPSMLSPTRSGGLKRASSWAGPRLPPSSGKVVTSSAPTRSTTALKGPISARSAAEISNEMDPSASLETRYTVSSVAGPMLACVGIASSSAALPVNLEAASGRPGCAEADIGPAAPAAGD